jgi:hypothetical protein
VDEAAEKKGFSPSFSGFILQIFIPPLPLTHRSPSPELLEFSAWAAHYLILGPYFLGFLSDPALGYI